MKSYGLYFFVLLLIITAGHASAKTVVDFIAEGMTKNDLEKGFVEVSRNVLVLDVPKGFPLSETCEKDGKTCKQMTWKAYCAGAILEDIKTDMMIITLDRCGYPNGKNRKYPPTEDDINKILAVFGTNVLIKIPGLIKRTNYLPKEDLLQGKQ